MGASGNQPVQNAFQGASQAMQQAGQTYGGLAGFKAPTAGAASIGGPQVAAGQLAATDMSAYMNPYTQQVIETGQADIERQRQMASQNLAAQAQRARAFGGSRQAVQEGVLAGEAARQAAQLSAQQRQAGYGQALQAGQFDIGQQMQAQQLNQARNIQQAQLQQQTALANQQAALAGAGVQQAAAGGLAGLGGQAFGMGQQTQQAIAQQGAQQRALQQQMIEAQRRQVMGAYGAPLAGLGALAQILGGTPYGQTSTTSQPFNPASLLMLA